MNTLLKPFDYLFVARPVRLFSVWGLFLAGYYVQEKASAATDEAGAIILGALPAFLWVGIALSILMAAMFVLNDVMERNSTSRDRKLSLIAPDFLTPKTAFIESAVLAVMAIALGFVFSWRIGAIFFAILFITGYLHNFPPFSFKNKSALGAIVGALGALLIFCAGWLTKGHVAPEFWLHAAPYVSIMIAVYLYWGLASQVTPAQEEKAGPAVASTVYAGVFFAILAVAASLILRDELIFYPTFFSLPFFIIAAVTLRKSDILRAMKYPVLLLVLTVSFKWRLLNSNYELFFVLLGVYLFCKLYYRLRFGVNYPSL